MPTRNVVLTDHQSDLIDKLVSSGRYQNASEVLCDGLRLAEIRESETRTRLEALRDAAREGIADVDAGRVTDFMTPPDISRYLSDLTQSQIRIAQGPRGRRL